jgi:hypothetical protein
MLMKAPIARNSSDAAKTGQRCRMAEHRPA